MAQTQRDSRWITIRERYDHYWPSRAVTSYPPGEYLVKNEVADGAMGKGKATEGRVDGSEATPPPPPKKRATKAKRTTKAKNPANMAADAKAPDAGPVDRVDAESVAAADSAGDRSGVDQASG